MSSSLLHSPAQVVQQLLIDLGLGTDIDADAAWPITRNNEPDTPDNVVTVYLTPGRTFGRTQPDGVVNEHPGVQIKVRSLSPDTGYAKADAIKVAIDTQVLRETVTIGASEYLVQSMTRTSNILSLGTESPTSRRHSYAINALVALRLVT